MRTLVHTEFAALLARADVRQAAFARLTGVTPRQVNNWCRGRAAVPRWAALLAIVLDDTTQDALTIMAEETAFGWHEILGVAGTPDAAEARPAMTGLARRYHPDKGGQPAQMTRINAAYAQALARRNA
jgi:transcriptional regulator with XRE-family HTH domain